MILLMRAVRLMTMVVWVGGLMFFAFVHGAHRVPS